jgi:hypothetical protein
MTGTKTYQCWSSMRQRCTNPKNKEYNSYGGRGIVVCAAWGKFENFYTDMGDKPEGKTLDRINNNGNYEKANCRWATYAEQMRNKTQTRLITYVGETLCLKDWGIRLGMKKNVLGMRINNYGWSVEKALSTPVGSFYGGRFSGGSLRALAEKYGLKQRTLERRVYELGWTLERAIQTPARPKKDSNKFETKNAKLV